MNTRCPNCKTDCGPAGEHVEYKATQDDAREGMTPGRVYFKPPDVECPTCGATLRYNVPLFTVIPPHWRIIKPATKGINP